MTGKPIEAKTVYLPSPGPRHTGRVLEAAVRRAGELKIKELLVPTETGKTALRAVEMFPKGTVIAVTYHSGAGKPFDDPLPRAARAGLEAAGARVLTCSHALSGAERGLSRKGGWTPLDLVADSLRIFGQGTKVAVEIALMAADAGLLTGKDLVSVGGSGRGVDTALVISPAHPNRLFELWVKEIICKPREKSPGKK